MTVDLRRLIETGHATGYLRFGDLVALLYSNCVGVRRSRLNLGDVSVGLSAQLPSHDHGDLIGWAIPEVQSSNLPDIVRSYVDGRMSSTAFRKYLHAKQILIGPELDQLIRSQESDNSSCFQDFARVLLWMGVPEMRPAVPHLSTPGIPLGEVNISKGRKNIGNGNILDWA